MKKETLDKFLEKLLGYVESGEIFLKEQLPDYVAQLLEWGFYEAMIYMCVFIGIVILLVLATGIFSWLLSTDTSEEFYMAGSGVCGFALVVFFVISVFVVTSSALTMVKISVAPKVYLIDYLRGQK